MNDNESPLRGRIALVTGASRGIGYEAALALAKAGAQVVARPAPKAAWRNWTTRSAAPPVNARHSSPSIWRKGTALTTWARP